MAGGSGSFNAVMEVTDSMRQSRKMDFAFLLAVFWIMLLVIPHTTAVVLAYPHQVLQQGQHSLSQPPSQTKVTIARWLHCLLNFLLAMLKGSLGSGSGILEDPSREYRFIHKA